MDADKEDVGEGNEGDDVKRQAGEASEASTASTARSPHKATGERRDKTQKTNLESSS